MTEGAPRYSVSKGITGTVVRYACPKCKSNLRSSVSDAGSNDTCPDCKTSFIVPGVKERREHEAHRLEQQQQKEKKRLDREQQKQRQVENKALESNARQALQEVARQDQRAKEQQRKKVLAGSNFDPSSHDWSLGGPYVYRCIEMGQVSHDWQSSLEEIINGRANEGWEYFRSESLVASRPNGCLAALFGNTSTEFNVVVLVFRKPTMLVLKERKFAKSR